MMSVEQNAELIREVMESDSCIEPNVEKLVELLSEDISSSNGTPMTDDEVMRFCLGDYNASDDDSDCEDKGIVPPELAKRFPKTSEYINSFF